MVCLTRLILPMALMQAPPDTGDPVRLAGEVSAVTVPEKSYSFEPDVQLPWSTRGLGNSRQAESGQGVGRVSDVGLGGPLQIRKRQGWPKKSVTISNKDTASLGGDGGQHVEFGGPARRPAGSHQAEEGGEHQEHDQARDTAPPRR